MYDGEINTASSSSSSGSSSYNVIWHDFAHFSDHSSPLADRLYAILVRNGTHVLFQAFQDSGVERFRNQIQVKLLCEITPDQIRTKAIEGACKALGLPGELVSIVVLYDLDEVGILKRVHALMMTELTAHRVSLKNPLLNEGFIAQTLYYDHAFLSRFNQGEKGLIPVAKGEKALAWGSFTLETEESLTEKPVVQKPTPPPPLPPPPKPQPAPTGCCVLS